jgi:hypothetical protein
VHLNRAKRKYEFGAVNRKYCIFLKEHEKLQENLHICSQTFSLPRIFPKFKTIFLLLIQFLYQNTSKSPDLSTDNESILFNEESAQFRSGNTSPHSGTPT